MGRPCKLAERAVIRLVDEGQLEIDSHGRIWRLRVRKGLRGGGSHVVPVTRRRAERRTPAGYLQIAAVVDGTRLYCGAHRLVWQNYRGDIPPPLEINHRNGIKNDNRPNNLQCVSASANATHAHMSGLIDQYGQKNPSSKLTDSEVAQIRLAYSLGGYSMTELGDQFGVAFQSISKIIRGQRRPKQGGPTPQTDQRHNVCDRDPLTGRFMRPSIEAA